MKSLFAQLSRRGNKQHSRPDSISSRFNSISERTHPDTTSVNESIIENLGPNPRDTDLRSNQSTVTDGSSIIQRETSRNPRDPQQNIRLSQKIASLSTILREMYSLELQIFGTENCLPEYEDKRNAQIREANLLFELVISTLNVWEDERTCNGLSLGDDELDIIHNIRQKANHLDPRNHRKARGTMQHRAQMEV